MYLANLHFQNKAQWNTLKDALEEFGRTAGLFDEISVKQLGKNESEPFQIQVRKFGSRAKGPQRNLIDVGYGVNQVLPVITELLRRDAPTMFSVTATGSTSSPQRPSRPWKPVLPCRRAGATINNRDA